MFVAALGTFAAVATLTRLAGQPDGLNVLGVVVAVVASRRVAGASARERLETAASLPLVAALTSLLALLLAHDRYVAEALIVLAMFVSIATRRAPPAVARTARLLTLPMLVLFVAPAPVHRGFWIDLPWYALVSAIAGAWVLLAGSLVPGPATRRAAAPPPPSARRPSATVRLATQSAVGLALAFATSQALFPHRWTWAIVTAFAVSGGARSRGDVLLRSGERLVGAIAGTALATVLAAELGGHTVASVAAIFALLAVGAVLRDAHYVAWAFCVTSMLALLYGLYGQSGADLVDERLAQNLLGAACMVAPAFVLMPVRTEAVIRRYAALVRDAIDDVRADPAAIEVLDHRMAMFETAARPALVGRRVAGLLGLASHRESAERVARVRAAATAARALAEHAD
jgi:hypothetical protein